MSNKEEWSEWKCSGEHSEAAGMWGLGLVLWFDKLFSGTITNDPLTTLLSTKGRVKDWLQVTQTASESSNGHNEHVEASEGP